MAENDNTKNFTITLRNNIKDAKIFIERVERSFIEVEKGTVCHWKVMAPGYKDQIGEVKVVSDINLTVTLNKIPPKPTPHNSYMKIVPKRGNYVVQYKELFKDTIPPTEEHEDEYLYTSHGYLWWKKLEIPSVDDFIVQDLGEQTTKALSQKAITEFLSEKANKADVYNKDFVDQLLSEKLDASEAVEGSVIEKVACVLKGLENISAGNHILCESYKFEVGTSAFGTIQEALDSSYNTIWLMSGSYNEDLVVNRNGITIVGFGDSVIHGSLTCNSFNSLTLRNVKLINDTPNEDHAAIVINKDLEGLVLDNVDIIVKGDACVLTNKRTLTNASINNSRFTSGVDSEGHVNNAFILNNVKNFDLSKNSIFGAVSVTGNLSKVNMSSNNLIVKEDSVFKLQDGKFVGKVNVYGNFAFSETIRSFIDIRNINFKDVEELNLIGNHICFNDAFVKLLSNNRNIDNSKAFLSYNTANCAATAKFVVDTESDPARLTPDDGNIITTSQPVTMEQVDGAVRIERERALIVEDRIESTLREHLNNFDNPHKVTKEQVGLGNVDNTSDEDKPISIATQAALDEKLDSADLPERLPNPTRLEIIFNNKFICEYDGSEPGPEHIADIHFDVNNSAELSWMYVKSTKSDEEIVNITTGGLYEKGEVLENEKVSWNPVQINNMSITNQQYNGEEINKDARFYTVTISEDYTPELTLTYSAPTGLKDTYRESISSETSYKFVNRIYWGASANETVEDEEILTFNSILTESLIDKVTINCEGGKYMYLAIPKDLIPDGMKIFCGNILYSAWERIERPLTNQHGYTTDYVIFRSLNKQTFDEIELTLK